MNIDPKSSGPIRLATVRSWRAAESQRLDPVIAERIRTRLSSGAYETSAVLDAVARRVLDAGDV